MSDELKAPDDLAGELEPWAAIHDDPNAIVACGERWKAVAAIIGCTLHGYNDGFGASFFTPDGGVIEIGPKLRKAIAALTTNPALIAENERLRAAVERLGSMQTFTMSRALNHDKDAELLARIGYAQAALTNGGSHAD